MVVTEVSRESLNFFAQFVDDGPKLEKLMEEVNEEMSANPPLPGAYTPKRGELCAAKFEDGFWYRYVTLMRNPLGEGERERDGLRYRYVTLMSSLNGLHKYFLYHLVCFSFIS